MVKDSNTGKFVKTLSDIDCFKCGLIFHPRFKASKFCSRKCSALAVTKDKSKKCLVCDAPTAKEGNTKYCSQSCYSASGKRSARAKMNMRVIVKPPWNKSSVTKVCETCEVLFMAKKSRESRSRFCSLSCRAKYFSGTKSPHYKIDRTTLSKKQERNDSAYSDWRQQVWLRDNFKCKIANPNCKGRIEAHHILAWRDYSELRYEVNNGITLCHAHHPRVRAEEKRLSPFFQELVSVSSAVI